jgi:hypothetical protein
MHTNFASLRVTEIWQIVEDRTAGTPPRALGDLGAGKGAAPATELIGQGEGGRRARLEFEVTGRAAADRPPLTEQ